MKNTIILGILLILLTACATQDRVKTPPLSEPQLDDILEPAQETQENTDAEETQKVQETNKIETPIVQQTTEIQETETIPQTNETEPQEVQTLNQTTQTTTAADNTFSQYLSTYSTLKGYTYTLNGKQYTVKGPAYKIILDKFVELQNVKLDDGTEERFYHYDTIYLDRQTETATAHCEGHDEHVKDKCYDGLIGKKLTIDYHEYNGILPHDWLGTFLNATLVDKTTDKYLVNNKQTTKIKITQEGTTFDLYIDEVTGLPLRVDIITPAKTTKYEYLKLAANNVKQADVTPSS